MEFHWHTFKLGEVIKQRAFKIMRRDPAESYGNISIYLYILEKTYSGTVVNFKEMKEKYFLYSLNALNVSIRGCIILFM